MKIAHIIRSPAAAGALTAKALATASVPEEKTEISHGKILRRPAEIIAESMAWRSLEQKKYFSFRPLLIT